MTERQLNALMQEGGEVLAITSPRSSAPHLQVNTVSI